MVPASEFNFDNYYALDLDRQGRFIDQATGQPIRERRVAMYLSQMLDIADDVTDIFVWVHGWRNDQHQATLAATRLFQGIETVYTTEQARYPQLRHFKGAYVAVRWPSQSSPLPWGYAKIRDRAHAMTESGYAEYSLAFLLGYLDEKRRPPAHRTLQTAGGQYLHCVGHSFGGRFLAQAITAAASPRPPTLPLLEPNSAFRFTVDNFLAFQMAAEPNAFTNRLRPLLENAPLQGPVCLTFSRSDRANCLWHRLAEGCQGIGCRGAKGPDDLIRTIRLRTLQEDYLADELRARVINVDAGWRYRRPGLSFQGAHSDFWYKESIHLLLTLANFAR